MNVMKHAWNMARAFAANFGGSAKEYLPGCLRMAWASRLPVVALKTNGINTIVYLEGVKVCTLKARTLGEVICKIVELGRALAGKRNDIVVKLRKVWRVLVKNLTEVRKT